MSVARRHRAAKHYRAARTRRCRRRTCRTAPAQLQDRVVPAVALVNSPDRIDAVAGGVTPPHASGTAGVSNIAATAPVSPGEDGAARFWYARATTIDGGGGSFPFRATHLCVHDGPSDVTVTPATAPAGLLDEARAFLQGLLSGNGGALACQMPHGATSTKNCSSMTAMSPSTPRVRCLRGRARPAPRAAPAAVVQRQSAAPEAAVGSAMRVAS
jgi:hypothetical protein